MSDAPNKRRGPIGWLSARSSRFWIVMAVVGCLYPLSLGPVGWLIQQRVISWGTAARVLSMYAPAVWVYTKTPRKMQVVYEWYGDLWAPGFIRRPAPKGTVTVNPGDLDYDAASDSNSPNPTDTP